MKLRQRKINAYVLVSLIMGKNLTYFIFTAQYPIEKNMCYIVTIFLTPFISIKSNQIQATVQLPDSKELKTLGC